MVQMYTRLADCTERMMAIRQSLGRTADSLLGAVPESNQKEPGEREKPSGSIAALNQMITRIEHLLVPLEQLATRYAELDSGNS
jgi:Mg2+ and Co2+ transporter CorA